MMRKLALALLVGTALSPVLFAPGCGGTSSPPDGGRDAKDGGNDARAGTGGGAGAGGATAGTTGASGMDGGAAGMDAAAGTGGIDASLDLSPMIDTAQPDLTPDGSQNLSFLFDTDTQGWKYTKYGSSPDKLPDVPYNLATLSGAPVWDATNDADNRTTSGSLKGTVPFKSPGDRIDFQAFSYGTAKYNWNGYKISAKVKLVSGGNIAASCPLKAWLYVSQAPDYMTPKGPVTLLQTGAWVTLNFDLTGAPVNLAAINQLGIQIEVDTCGLPVDGGADAGDGGADAGDGGADAADGGADAHDASADDGGTDAVDAAVDAATDLLVDAGLGDVITDVSDAVVLPVTATTAVILIDNVIVSVK